MFVSLLPAGMYASGVGASLLWHAGDVQAAGLHAGLGTVHIVAAVLVHVQWAASTDVLGCAVLGCVWRCGRLRAAQRVWVVVLRRTPRMVVVRTIQRSTQAQPTGTGQSQAVPA